MKAKIGFISIDWGTTNLRIRFVSIDNFQILDEFHYNQGLKVMDDRWKKNEKNNLDKKTYLLEKLFEFIDQTQFDHNNIKNIIISGMASSNLGIEELDYSTIPLNLSKPVINTKTIEFNHKTIYLISGLKSNDDIMRGEETQLIGIAEEFIKNDKVVIIIPGTHSKHIYSNNGIIEDFKTFMTGELFKTVSENTILSKSIEHDTLKNGYKISFLNGINEIKKSNSLMSSIFKTRINDLLYKKSKEENYYFLSGLFIGDELLKLAIKKIEKIIVFADAKLMGLYMMALVHFDTRKEIICVPEKKIAKSQAIGQYLIYQQFISKKISSI